MASFAQLIHAEVNNRLGSTTPPKVEFDSSPTDALGLRCNMFPVTDPIANQTFCEDMGGSANYQFDGWDTDKYGLYNKMDSLMKSVRKIRGDLGDGYSVWKVDATGVRAFGTLTDGLYRYIFEATFHWSLSN